MQPHCVTQRDGTANTGRQSRSSTETQVPPRLQVPNHIPEPEPLTTTVLGSFNDDRVKA